MSWNHNQSIMLAEVSMKNEFGSSSVGGSWALQGEYADDRALSLANDLHHLLGKLFEVKGFLNKPIASLV
jgi:hypothetical protein